MVLGALTRFKLWFLEKILRGVQRVHESGLGGPEAGGRAGWSGWRGKVFDGGMKVEMCQEAPR